MRIVSKTVDFKEIPAPEKAHIDLMRDERTTVSEDVREARSVAGKQGGPKGAAARWGDNHGATESVRAFTATVARFRKYVPNLKDRAAFISAALEKAMDRAHFPKD